MTITEYPLRSLTIRLDTISLVLQAHNCNIMLSLIEKKTGEIYTNQVVRGEHVRLQGVPNGSYQLILKFRESNVSVEKLLTFDVSVECNPIYILFTEIKKGKAKVAKVKWALKNNGHFKKLFYFYRMSYLNGVNFINPQAIKNILLKLFFEESDANIVKNALLLISYTFDKHAVLEHHDNFLTKIAGFPEDDHLRFCKGLIYHKIDNYFLSEKQFRQINYDECETHVRPAKNYRFLINPPGYLESQITIVETSKKDSGFIFFISCDYSYFLAYIDALLEGNKSGAGIHFHVVLNENEMQNVHKIQEYVKKSGNGLSYSYAPEGISSQGVKTYYACARYLFLEEIFQIYRTNLIIVDIDINFSSIKLEDLSSQLDEDKISLVFSTKDLPWANILAGFSFFGKNTFPSSFVKYTKEFLIHSYIEGSYEWTLDQTAMNYAYRSLSIREKASIRTLSLKVSQLGSVNYYRKKAIEIKKEINEELG